MSDYILLPVSKYPQFVSIYHCQNRAAKIIPVLQIFIWQILPPDILGDNWQIQHIVNIHKFILRHSIQQYSIVCRKI